MIPLTVNRVSLRIREAEDHREIMAPIIPCYFPVVHGGTLCFHCLQSAANHML